MKLKKFLLLLPLVAVGLVGCDTRDVDPTPEPVEPDPTDPDPVTPTDPDPDDSEPGDEEPVEEVDYHALAINTLKEMETIGIEGLHTSSSTYNAGTDNETVYSYEYPCAGIYTEDYIWAYHSASNGYESSTVVVNHDGLCATASLNRRNVVEYEDITDYSGNTSNFADEYYQPFTYISKENTTWDEETSTLTIELAIVEDSLEVFIDLFVDGMHDPEYVEIGFDSDMEPSTAAFDHTYESYAVYNRKFNGKFVDVSELEDQVELAKPYETYDQAEGLQQILDALKNAESYKVEVKDSEEYIWGLFNKNQGVLQYYAYEGYTGTLNSEDEGYYVTFNGVTGNAVDATSADIEGSAYDGYFAKGASGTTPDYDVAAEFFQYEGVGTDGNPIYGIRLELGTSLYPYLLPAYPLIEDAYGDGSFLNGYETIVDGQELTDKYYHLQISGTVSNPTMTFSYYASDGYIYTDTIVFSDLNSTSIPYTSINYPSKWSSLFSDDIDELDLLLNAQDTSGTLSFDNDVPFILFKKNAWTLDQSYLNATAAYFYLYGEDLEDATSMFDDYLSVISSSGWTGTTSNTTSGKVATYKNSAETIEIQLEAYEYTYYNTSYYYLDLYVYGLKGNFETLITNLVGGSTVVSNTESRYTFSVNLVTISSVFPYVNSAIGYEDYLAVYTSDNTYYWGLTYISLYFTYSSYIQTYLDLLYAAVNPVYEADGWSVEELTASSRTYYRWSKTVGDTTYTLEASWATSNNNYYYYVCLMFGATTAE